MEELKSIIKNVVKIPDTNLEYVLSHFQSRSLSKDDFFLKEGKVCSEIAFVHTGMLRLFYHDDEGEQISCYFASNNQFITSNASFNSGTITKENIQAVIPTQLSVISKTNFEKLNKEVPGFQELERNSKNALGEFMESRVAMLQIKSAQERYRYMVENQGKLIQNVPLQYLASYLGISPQHLSRIRKKK